MVRRLYRLAALCCALAATLALAPHASAGTLTFGWTQLSGEIELFAPDGTETGTEPIAGTGTLTIAYDPKYVYPGYGPGQAVITVSSGTPYTPTDQFMGANWSSDYDGDLTVQAFASGTAPPGEITIIFWGQGRLGDGNAPPPSLAGAGYPMLVEVDIGGSEPGSLSYGYNMVAVNVVPEPSGVLLLVVGLGGLAVVRRVIPFASSAIPASFPE